MASGLNSGAKISNGLKEFLDSERHKVDSKVAIIKIIVDDFGGLDLDTFVAGSLPTSITVFKENLDLKNPAFYLLHQGPGLWCFVSFIPDGSVKVRQRMLYASSRQILKEYLGAKHFISDHHFTSLSDVRCSSDGLSKALGRFETPSKDGVSYTTNRLNNLKLDAKERRALLSKVELAREEARDMENIAREEMTKSLLSKDVLNSKSEPSLDNLKSGGYHQVTLPFGSDTKSALLLLKSGQIVWMELAVNSKKDGIELVKKVLASELSYWDHEAILPLSETHEPRFYVTLLGDAPANPTSSFYNTTPAFDTRNSDDSDVSDRETKSLDENVTTLKYVLLYSCPPKSPPRLRMVYSTTIGSIIAQIQEAGLPLDFKVELFDDLPLKQRKFQYLYNCIRSSEGGVQRLGTTPALNKLIHDSHQRSLQESIEEKNLQRICPKNSSRHPSVPHPVFGLPLPALASQSNPRI